MSLVLERDIGLPQVRGYCVFKYVCFSSCFGDYQFPGPISDMMCAHFPLSAYPRLSYRKQTLSNFLRLTCFRPATAVQHYIMVWQAAACALLRNSSAAARAVRGGMRESSAAHVRYPSTILRVPGRRAHQRHLGLRSAGCGSRSCACARTVNAGTRRGGEAQLRGCSPRMQGCRGCESARALKRHLDRTGAGCRG